jgi:DNA-binding NarL/FixJ family response regulator
MTKAPPIRVLLVDDNTLFRQTIRSLLTPYPNIELVGEASDGCEAVASVGRLRPTLVLMDINMPKMDGVTATQVITSQYPDVAILGLSCETREYFVHAMLRAGAFDVLKKEQNADDVYDAIQRANASISDE